MKKYRIIAVILIVALCCMCLSACKKTPPPEDNIDQDLVSDAGAEDQDITDVTLTGETIEVMLYFADEENNLTGEKRIIPKTEGIARSAIEELIKGPATTGSAKRIVPEGTKLLDINIKADEKLAIVSFSKELKDFATKDDAEAGIYAIVNTLCEFKSVDKVQIWIEGKVVDDIKGIKLSDPLTRK